ncbi:MAG: anti-sigma factor [Caldilineaceae bacterium]
MQDHQASPNDDPNPQGQNQERAGRTLSDAEVNELLPGFVLGALEPDEMLAVAEYVNQHQELQARVAELEAATAQLAYTAPYAPLPARAKQQLLQRAQADAAHQSAEALQRTEARSNRLAPTNALLRKSTASPALFPPRPRPGAGQGVRPTLPAAPQPQPRQWFGAVARTLVVASAAATFFLVVMSASQLRNTTSQLAIQLAATQAQLSRSQTQNTELQATIQTLQKQAAQLATAQAQLAQLRTQNLQLQTLNQTLQQKLENQSTQIAVLSGPQRQITLAGTKDAPGATGAFYMHNNRGVLVLNNLPPLAETQAYQLWFIPAQGDPRPSDVIKVTKDAPNTLLVTIPAEDQNFAVLGVTVEPAKGSSKPTGALVLRS